MKTRISAGLLLWIFSNAPMLAQVAPTEANLRAGVATGGTIVFSNSGTISLSAPLVVALNTSIDANGNNVVIDGQNQTRLFQVNAGVQLTLANLVIANGLSHGTDSSNNTANGQDGFGGALRNNGGIVTLVNCVVTNNGAVGGSGFVVPGFLTPATVGGAAFGGAIWQSSGSLSVQGGMFRGNNAAGAVWGIGPEPGLGGAICARGGTVQLAGTILAENTAVGGGTYGIYPGGEGAGGALYADGTQVELDGVRFIHNFALAQANSLGFGGAISMPSGTLAVSNASFTANVAHGGFGASPRGIMLVDGYPANGGAIYVGTNATASVRNSFFGENVSLGGRRSNPNYVFLGQDGPGFGGAIYNDGALNAVNVTFFANAATNFWQGPPGRGGAIFNTGTAGLTNVTSCSNISQGAMLVSVAGTLTLKNSLLAESRYVDVGTGITDAGHNLSATSTPVFTESSSRTNQNPKLGPLGDYDGPTPTFPLLAGSPAIDAGDDAAAPADDQRGRSRPFGAHSDIGAFESSPPYFILGTVRGYLHPAMTADAGGPAQSVANGTFRFRVPAGTNAIQFHGTNTVFRPNPLTLDVGADMNAEARAFAFHALAYDPDLPAPTFTFAGKVNETWEFDVCFGSNEWSPYATNAFSADGIYSLTFSNNVSALILNAVRR